MSRNYYRHLIGGSAPAPTGLFTNAVAYYKLDETSGQAIDVVNGYNGTLFGTINRDGEWYEFASNEAEVRIPNQNDLNFVDAQNNSTDFVIKTEVIFNGFNSDNRAWIVSKRDVPNSNYNEWQFLRDEANNQFVFDIWNDQNQSYRLTYNIDVVFGQKYIIGVTFINNELKLFVNGVVGATITIPVDEVFASTASSIKLGNEDFNPTLYLVGKLKETAIIKGSGWTNAQIIANYNNGLGTTI